LPGLLSLQNRRQLRPLFLRESQQRRGQRLVGIVFATVWRGSLLSLRLSIIRSATHPKDWRQLDRPVLRRR
jgi:hypothetical protein